RRRPTRWSWYSSARSLALDRRGIHRRALCLDAEVRDQVDRDIGSVDHLGEPLLAEAVVHPPLHRAQRALRDAVGRPGGEGAPRRFRLGEVRQVLQADALIVLAVAGGAGEVVRPRAIEEGLLDRKSTRLNSSHVK